MSLMRIEKDHLTLDGQPFYLACGDIQYFRIHESEWKHRLEVMKDFGLTAVQTYCPWNLHEPSEGVYDFGGMLNLGRFLETCQEVGLKVMLRPTPYICGEWDFGGLPWWLLKDRNMHYRCAYPPFLEKIDAYYRHLCPEFLPYLSTKGGPIIAVCIENEYGTFGSDLNYMNHLAESLKTNGVDVPLYQTDPSVQGVALTKPLGVWQGINYRIESDVMVPALQQIQPDMPALVGEYWSGRSVYWGESGASREVAPIAKAYRTALDLGAYVTFYMFAGGTNFGFMNGSRVTRPFGGDGEAIFRAIVTSYNCDAPLSEDGTVTEKYYACRRELAEYLGKEVREDLVPAPEAQAIEGVKLTQTAPLFDNLDAMGAPVEAAEPLTFEQLDCPYGFVLYSTTLPYGLDKELPLTLTQVHDRAMVFVDGEYKGTFRRDFPDPEILCRADKPHRLDILVENMGRINTRPQFVEEKGLIGEVKLGCSRVYGFTCRPFTALSPIHGSPFQVDLSSLRFQAAPAKGPRFLKGAFQAKGGVSTNLHTANLGKGVAFVNGFNLGRYWHVGPQESLYIPGALLKEGENELILMELTDQAIDTVNFVPRAIFDGAFNKDEV